MIDEPCVVAAEFEVNGVLVQVAVRRGRVRSTDRDVVVRLGAAAHRDPAAIVEAAMP